MFLHRAFVSESSLTDLKKQFNDEVIEKLKGENTTAANNSSNSDKKKKGHGQDLRAERPIPPAAYGESSNEWQQDLRDPFAYPPRIGGSDLDPLGRHGMGGMIMDPRDLYGGRGPNRGFDPNYGLPPGARLPPGAVPPGARFDPFGPPPPGPHPNRLRGPRPPGGGPNPDHEKPPDDYNDMFM